MMENLKKVAQKLKNEKLSTPVALNYIQNIVEKYEEKDERGVNNFFVKLNQESKLSDGQDGLMMNGKWFDWKELEKVELIEEMLKIVVDKVSCSKEIIKELSK